MNFTIARFRKGLEAMNLSYTELQLEQMQAFVKLLQHWGRIHNLVAKSQLDRLLAAHILDSLALVPYLRGKHVADMGSGGGFPGMPLAIMRPDLKFALLDATGKKVRYLNLVAHELDLQHVQPIQVRAEEYRPKEKVHSVVTRALGDIELQLKYCQGWLDKQGVLLALKGPGQEQVPAQYRHERIALDIPGLKAQRFLYKVERWV